MEFEFHQATDVKSILVSIHIYLLSKHVSNCPVIKILYDNEKK